jgi:hypothetical protein
MRDIDPPFYECDVSANRFLRKPADGCVKLHADNWIFGSDVTHGPQSDTTYSFGNVTYRFAMGGNGRRQSFYECDISTTRFLRKLADGCVKLHADNWIFGSDVTHGPQGDATYSFGNVVQRFANGWKWETMTFIFRVRDVFRQVSSEARQWMCQTSCG